MTGKPQLPVDQIAKLAENIKVITNYAENNGFAPGLLDATVSPIPSQANKLDWPMISLVSFTCLLLLLLAIITFHEPITPKTANFLFVAGMLLVVFSSVAAHKKFENSVITAIIGIGMSAILLVGAGILTPLEAVKQLQEMQK